MVSRIADIRKKLPAARARAEADVAKKRKAGVPIATLQGGQMLVEQVVDKPRIRLIETPTMITLGSHNQVRKAVKRPANAKKSTEKRPAAAN